MAATTKSTQNIVVKITNGTDIRRFTANEATLAEFARLNKKVAEAFELQRPFKLTYVDDENDRITLSSDEELIEAITLARIATPPVLRLTVHVKAAPPAHEAATNTQDEPHPTDPMKNLAPFLQTLAEQLPAAMQNLPEEMRHFLPHAELDIAATIAANVAAKHGGEQLAGEQADPFCPAMPHGPNAKPGVHVGVTCDKSGESPIVGPRYHLVGHDYDLCEAEFAKLSDKEKALFRKVAAPGGDGPAGAVPAADAPPTAPAADKQKPSPTYNPMRIHPGVQCDRSGQCPIVGTRYHLRGHNYDLCEAEYEKLCASDKLSYDAVEPPAFPPPAAAAAAAAFGRAVASAGAVAGAGAGAGGAGAWRPGPCRGMGSWRAAMGHGMGHGAYHHGPRSAQGDAVGPKLAARFVRDVTIFDGTQMPPNTSFTKIWRIKNVGEVPWPMGSKMVFVGGDQMTTELSVPLSRELPVQAGEEVDVAVEMTAPAELGRYLGYWRLTGPHGRRKFGQRVWCHVQVVDPSQPPAAFDDFATTQEEIERKKSALAATEKDADADAADAADAAGAAGAGAGENSGDASASTELLPAPTPPPPPPTLAGEPTPPAAAAGDSADFVMAPAAPVAPKDDEPAVEPAYEASQDKDKDAMSDDGVLVSNEPIGAEAMATEATEPPSSANTPPDAKAALVAMGFSDAGLIEAALAKHGDDLGAAARDLAAAAEWDALLDDLAEMGFSNRELNKTLMLKHSGNIKRTVKDLVEA